MEKALFRNNLIKKITAALMIVMLLIPYCFAQVTFGDNKSDLKNAQNQQNDIQNKKKETEDKIAQLKAQSSDLTSLIQGLDAQMGELSASLDDINTQIAELEAEIEETQAKLEQAEADKESQYGAMKLRIQFMYEHNDYTYVEVLLSSQSMADMLNKFEYINKISEYDRQMLEESVQAFLSQSILSVLPPHHDALQPACTKLLHYLLLPVSLASPVFTIFLAAKMASFAISASAAFVAFILPASNVRFCFFKHTGAEYEPLSVDVKP